MPTKNEASDRIVIKIAKRRGRKSGIEAGFAMEKGNM
jgi:hypothetical protein